MYNFLFLRRVNYFDNILVCCNWLIQHYIIENEYLFVKNVIRTMVKKKKEEPTDKEIRIFYEDLNIKQALLDKDKKVTTEFYYQSCFPIFKSLCERFYTDCESPKELMDEVYLMMLYPSKSTGKCQLENYNGKGTLRSWIKTLGLFYCYNKFKTKPPVVSPPPLPSEKNDGAGDRTNDELISNTKEASVEMDTTKMLKEDAMCLIALMPNKRYAKVIRLFKIEGYSNEEVADELGVTLANLYNIHARAEAQFQIICEREEHYVK